MRISIEIKKEVSAKVGIKVSIKVRMATAKEIRFKVKVSFSDKS
jgi:hypothetical protein